MEITDNCNGGGTEDAEKGLFTDLYSLMEQDEDVNKEDFIPPQTVLKLVFGNKNARYIPYEKEL